MALSDLQQLTSYWLDDLNMTYFTPTQINAWLNNAQVEVQKMLLQARANFYLTPVQTTMVVGQSDYVLPSDFMTEHRLEVVMSGVPPFEDLIPVAPMTLNQQDLVPNNLGTPAFYYLKKNRLVLFPSPDTPLTLRLYYSYQVANMVNLTDLPDVPPPYVEMIAVLAAYDGLLKDGRSTQALLEKRNFYLEMLKQESDMRNEDAPRGIVQTGSDVSQMFGFF